MAAETKPPSTKGGPNDPHRKPSRTVLRFFPTDHIFAAIVALLLAKYNWPLRWFLSGAPVLTYLLLVGAGRGERVLAYIPLWTLLALTNLAYSVAATSWLLYWVYSAICYPTIVIVCLFQFSFASKIFRRSLRSVLRGLQFTNDKIALFDLPALEIDTEVEGLLCIRGASFSFSSLTLIAYGIEVGIKLSEDMELALATDKVVVKLFRRIDVSDIYGNIKGGEYEMTFGKLARPSSDSDEQSLMVDDTPLLKAAADTGDTSRPTLSKMHSTAEHLTGGKKIQNTSVKSGLGAVQHLSADDALAEKHFRKLIQWIEDTSAITTSRHEAEAAFKAAQDAASDVIDNTKSMRAAICSQLHDKPSIPHPAEKSIKVTTIKNMSSPSVKRFQHRFPLLLRLLLNPIAYFHPVFFDSITVGGSGKFLQHILQKSVFKNGNDTGIKNLKQRISDWLANANFVVELADIKGLASVPVNTAYDIDNYLSFGDIMAYRTLPNEVDLTQIIRLGGADARIIVPSFLLPHHEHILPAPPTEQDRGELQEQVDQADGKPQRIQAQKDLEHRMKDECEVIVSAHVRLPACFDQSLLDFIAALVKATKIIEMEKEDPVEKEEVRGFKKLAREVGIEMHNSMRRVAIDAATNDRWIAKLVGKVTKKLEDLVGDVGYSGSFPVPLDKYRRKAESASKIMP